MPSNGKTAMVCPECYLGTNHSVCKICGTESKVLYFGTKITVPKKNDKRAWKRVLSGEWFWDRRKVQNRGINGARKRQSDTTIVYDREYYDFELPSGRVVKRVRIIEGTEREVDNYLKLPDVDLGG
jgi:hypothetical protein